MENELLGKGIQYEKRYLLFNLCFSGCCPIWSCIYNRLNKTKPEALKKTFFNKEISVSFNNSGEGLSSLAFLRLGQTNNSVKTGGRWDDKGIIFFMELFDIAGRQSC